MELITESVRYLRHPVIGSNTLRIILNREICHFLHIIFRNSLVKVSNNCFSISINAMKHTVIWLFFVC